MKMMNGKTRFSVGIGLMLICITLFTPAARAAEPGRLTLPVKQVFTGAGAPSEIFSYKLTPGDAFTITGTGDHNIEFTFAQPGEYTYELRHTTAPRLGYTYDQAVYTLRIIVKSNLTVIVLIYNERGEKEAAIQYKHAYKKPGGTGGGTIPIIPTPVTVPIPGCETTITNITTTAPHIATTTPEDITMATSDTSTAKPSSPDKGPKTGDDSQATLYIILFCLAGLAALGSAGYLLIGRRRGRKHT